MDRRDFIMDTCKACLSGAVISGLLTACSTARYVSGKLNENGILLDASEFKTNKKGKEAHRLFVIVRNDALQFPICVYRFSEAEYSAVWMQCTHQGAELQTTGDYLHCPAHGSEFNNTGKVMNGPADVSLRNFPVTINNDQLFIDLRKK